MGQAHQPPLTTDLGQSTEQEPAKAPCLLDLAKDRLDHHLPPRVHRTDPPLHSPRILANPRSRNRRKPRASLIWPKTGSTITFRREYTARPSAVFSFACIFALAVPGGEARSPAPGGVRRRGP